MRVALGAFVLLVAAASACNVLPKEEKDSGKKGSVAESTSKAASSKEQVGLALKEKGYWMGPGEHDWDGPERGRMTRMLVQVLAADESPIIGATVRVVRQGEGPVTKESANEAATCCEPVSSVDEPVSKQAANESFALQKKAPKKSSGKKRMWRKPMSEVEETNKSSNVFTILIAAGSGYDIFVSAPGHEETQKTIMFDQSKPVRVAFPMHLYPLGESGSGEGVATKDPCFSSEDGWDEKACGGIDGGGAGMPEPGVWAEGEDDTPFPLPLPLPPKDGGGGGFGQGFLRLKFCDRRGEVSDPESLAQILSEDPRHAAAIKKRLVDQKMVIVECRFKSKAMQVLVLFGSKDTGATETYFIGDASYLHDYMYTSSGASVGGAGPGFPEPMPAENSKDADVDLGVFLDTELQLCDVTTGDVAADLAQLKNKLQDHLTKELWEKVAAKLAGGKQIVGCRSQMPAVTLMLGKSMNSGADESLVLEGAFAHLQDLFWSQGGNLAVKKKN